jgi:RNA polymerase sigma factor (sigma-70 family)
MNKDDDRTDSLPTRPSLLSRLENFSDDASWREFYLAYEERIRAFARRRGLGEHDAQEVAQDVFRRVAQTIHDYKHPSRRGAFRAWLFQLARWRTTDKLRQRGRDGLHAAVPASGPSTGTGAETSALDELPSAPELFRQFELDAQRHLLETLLSRIEPSVSHRSIQIFQMAVLDDVPVPRVAELFHTRPSAVYVVKHRVMEKLRAEVAELAPVID